MTSCGGTEVIKTQTATIVKIRCPHCSHPQQCNCLLLIHIAKAHVPRGWKCPRCPCTFASSRARLPHLILVHRERYNLRKGLSSIEPCHSPQGWLPPADLKFLCEDDDIKSGKATTTNYIIDSNNNNNNDSDRPLHHNTVEEGGDDDKKSGKAATTNYIIDSNNNNNNSDLSLHRNIIVVEEEDNDEEEGESSSSLDDDDSDADYEPPLQFRPLAKKENKNPESRRRPLVPDYSTKANNLVPSKRRKIQDTTTTTTTWYKCKLCGYRSLEKKPLAMHIVDKHDGENLQCSICRLEVSSAQVLEIHYRDTHRRMVGMLNDTTRLDPSVSIIEMNLDDLAKDGINVTSNKPINDASSNLSDDDDDVEFVPMNIFVKPKKILRPQWNWGNCVPVVRSKTNQKSGVFQFDKSSENQMVVPKTQPMEPTIKDPRKCVQCGHTFATATNMARHLKNSHVQGAAFKCPLCPCVFSRSQGLRIHQGIRHSQPTK